eukprot:CAMPEP_0194095326 /NCGR_PEP_ID=MMETSP0149-20130528/56772_1 /TAXON_ID=122233 /ORGANISM="Chaetoceros debilis, Strain MM31A-1" /LENGTH=226 /DNA_ID=CAMNT_0038781267 /DNA_START=91 /DNA_END=774 /DNA_ORIENTATION=+
MKGAAINFAASIAIYLSADAGVSALDSEKLTRHRKVALPTKSFDFDVEDRFLKVDDAGDLFDMTVDTMSLSMPSAAPSEIFSAAPSIAPTGDTPSIAPTGDTPSGAPTGAAPTAAPTAVNPNCINAGTHFMRTDVRSGNEAFLNCKIVDASPEQWCGKGGATHCPKACGTCPTEGCEDSKVLFKTRFENTLTCSFNSIQSGDVVRMCQDPNIRQACRSTCGYCKAL